jgi:hypothetical protein
MDTSLSVRVFEWKGDLHCTVDRIGRTDHRRHAHRDRLASFTTKCDPTIGEIPAMTWAVMRLVDHLAISVEHSRAAGPASPVGDDRGQHAERRASVQEALDDATLQTFWPSVEGSVERSETP